MIKDGWILPDKDMQFTPRFDLKGCLAAFHSFLRNYKVGDKAFDVFMTEECKRQNVNMRVVLPLLQMGSGLLSRKQEPNNGLMRRSILLPNGYLQNGKDFGGQLVSVIGLVRKYWEGANLTEPFQLKDGVVLPKSRLSYAVLAYVGELGQEGYPDSGCYLYLRNYNQLGRFLSVYGP